VSIDAHRSSVERRMEAVLAALDIDPARDLGVAREQLRLAARWHDEGKHHPRFQARMGADPDGPPLAKPAPGHRADRGDGWRHEQLSAGFAWAYSERDPVVTVIVTGHHGAGLGLFDRDAKALLDGWESCNPSVLDALDELFGPCGRYELERARLTRSLGLHRLCYLEALLRCADMQVSREGG
jgi:CRISPR-associated endonuclease/helicase Cas3